MTIMAIAWSSADLTGLAPGASPPATGELAGYVTDFPNGGGARVVYCVEDGHIWELYCPVSTTVWSSADLTDRALGAPALFNGELAGYVTDFPSDGCARVVYCAEDGHI
jgi:hypothetical protein